MEHFGLLSVLPPVMAIVLAFATRQVLVSLFLSIWLGASIISGGNPITGFARTIQDYIAGSIADPYNASIITYCLTLGGMIGIISKSGGMKAVADWLAHKARSAKSGQLATLFMGFIIFFDDYTNTLLVGNTMRPITDKLKISREKLAYICDSTAAPVASIALISTWVGYEIGVIKGVFNTLDIQMNTYEAFIRSIPFRFYSILALFFVFAVSVLGRDFGPMLKAERRARKLGKVIADDATPLATKELTEMEIKEGVVLRWYNAIIPVFSVVVVVVIGLFIDGYREIIGGENSQLAVMVKDNLYSFESLREIIGFARANVAMMWGAFTGALLAAVLALTQRILTLREAVDAWIDGAKSFVIAVMIIVLAWGISILCKDLGTAVYLVGILQGKIWVGFIPVAVFLLGCLIAFATGTSYGTIAILMPIAVPLYYYLSCGQTNELFFATIGAVFTGAVFGDHCSPISDTTIMSSMSCASDHIDHVKTQIPYALTVAAIAVFIGFLPAAFKVSPFISILSGMGIVFMVVRFLGGKTD